jgi:hypothetical protein
MAVPTSVNKRSHEYEQKQKRSGLTNDHLEDIYKTYTTNMTPEYNKFVAEKRCNTSH